MKATSTNLSLCISPTTILGQNQFAQQSINTCIKTVTYPLSSYNQFSEQKVHFLLKTSDAVNDPLSLSAPGISDGEWHNVTVRASLTSYVLDLDGKASSSRDFGTAYDFDSLDIVEMAISGAATVPPNNQEIPGEC